MRYLFLLIFISQVSVAQITDDFTDGDFTNNPVWVGDVASWQIISGQLNSNNTTVSSSFYLATASTSALGVQWEFWVNFKQATSSANYMDVYLISDIQNLNGSGNGYFVRIGGSTDEISLYKKTAGTVLEIIEGTDGRSQVNSSDNFFKIKVTRNSAGLFTLMDDNSGAGTNFFIEGTATDNSFATSSFFGISVTQSTASFFNKHFFDSISVGNIVVDLTPPTITSTTATSANTVDVLFSEAVDLTTSETETNYSVNNGLGTPTSAIRNTTNNSLVTLTFASNFSSGQLNTLTVNNITDLSNNTIAANSTSAFTYNAPVTAQPFDIVISEIMFEPLTTAQLNKEYVEIYNRSSSAINLNGWLLSDGGSLTPNFGNYILQPGSFLILCATGDVPFFTSFGNVLGISPAFPSLNNDIGDDLKLFDNNGVLIDEVVFDNDFYNNTSKDDGGYSIEKIDLDFTCIDVLNWRASEDIKGGTPGVQNSINGNFADNTPPQLVRAYPVSATVIDLFFSEPVDADAAILPNNYNINQGIGAPLTAVLFKNKVTLTLSASLQAGIIYTISVIDTIKDCPGNLIAGDLFVKAGLAENPVAYNLLVNEILFNPVTDGFDYVELYNVSTKIIDLKNVYIANVDLATNTVDSKYLIYPEGYLLFPKEYVALTENSTATALQYPSDAKRNILDIASLPSYDDAEGGVAIADFALNVLDQFNYNEDYHYPILNDKEGVSLERMSFFNPTQDKRNWHSAAQSVHYGTPGYRNSQAILSLTSQEMNIEPEVFSPDNDGYNDVLSIDYNLDKAGYTATVKIFDGDGREMKVIANNELIAPAGSFFWDGITEKNEKARIGIYVVMMEATNIDGNKKKFKKGFVVAGKL